MCLFSARGRVIDEFRSKLNEESIKALIGGGDRLYYKYDLKRKQKVQSFNFLNGPFYAY